MWFMQPEKLIIQCHLHHPLILFTLAKQWCQNGTKLYNYSFIYYIKYSKSVCYKILYLVVHEACKRGFRTLYTNAPKLLGALKVAKVKGTLETELKKIERCQLLILDDLFIVPLDAKERPILLDIIEDRHERKSIIITSQYPSSNWYDMVGDPTIADAILDHIIHTAHTIELYGESMRKLRAKKNGKF